MATARSQEATCRIVQDRILKLKTSDTNPWYSGIAVMADKVVVTDFEAGNLQIFNRQDGKLICRENLEGKPCDVCVLSDTEFAVCLGNVGIDIMALTSRGLTRVKTLDLSSKGFYWCHSVSKWREDKMIVSGWRREGDAWMFCWAVVSKDGGLESTNDIYSTQPGDRYSTRVTVMDATVYISCYVKSDSTKNGVYAFNVFKPQKPQFVYQHQELKAPWSIMADRGNVFVHDRDSYTVHQLSVVGELLTIHTIQPRVTSWYHDVRHGLLYTTTGYSNKITLYTLEYQQPAGIPAQILHMDHRSMQNFEEALKDGEETLYKIQIILVGKTDVGKTTLIRRLFGEEVTISGRHNTEGVTVYTNCCDVSLSTCEWRRRAKDSEQDYNLQRLVNIMNKNYEAPGEVVYLVDFADSNQRERTDDNLMKYVDDDAKKTGATENESDPLREMLDILKQSPNKTFYDNKKFAHVTILDYAGHYAFYTTHQMLLSRRAIYILVLDTCFDVSDLVEEECYPDINGKTKYKVLDLAEMWMNCINSYASPDKDNLNSTSTNTSNPVVPPPVILVGTHIDQSPKMKRCQEGQRYLQEIHSYLENKPTAVHLVDEVFAIDNTVVDSELEKLKKKIVEVASQQPYWGEQIPTRWFLLEQKLMRLKEDGVKVVSRATVESMNREGTVQIKDSEELDKFLRYLHETRIILYFSIEILRDNIVLDPQWFMDALASLINAWPTLPNNPGDNNITQKWSSFKRNGILTLELVDALWTKEGCPELHDNKSHILMLMEQFNILAKPRSCNEMGEKTEDYFLAPCVLCQETPPDVITPEQDPSLVTTPELCYIFSRKYLPTPIFHRLLAACVAHWPVAKSVISENLIFCGCCIFDLDLFHRLTVYIKGHVVYAKITKKVKDEISTKDVKLCSKVRRFMTLNLDRIISYLAPNLEYELLASFQTWPAYEGNDHVTPMTPEKMNHSRLHVVLVTVCGNAMRDVLHTHVPSPHKDIYQAILANKTQLTSGQGRPLLNSDQYKMVFPDPQGNTIGNVDHFDLPILYTLIRNISTVPAPVSGWGTIPQGQPRDKSLGASIERIVLYRNHLIGNSMDDWINQQDFHNYLSKIDAVLDDIEQSLGRQGYRTLLERLKRHVISVFEVC